MALRKYKDGGRVPVPETVAETPSATITVAAAPEPTPAAEENPLLKQLPLVQAADARPGELTARPADPPLTVRKAEFLDHNPHLRQIAQYLGPLHHEVMKTGVADESDEYFRELKRRLNAAGVHVNDAAARDPDDEPQPRRVSIPVSAPVSREIAGASTGRAVPTQVHLTPLQREHAKIAGVDEITYARNLQELDRRKKLGMYPNSQ